MKRFILALAIFGAIAIPFGSTSNAADGITTDVKPSDINLQTNDGAGKFYQVLEMNSGG